MRLQMPFDAFSSQRKRHLEVAYREISDGVKWDELVNHPQFSKYFQGLYRRLVSLENIGLMDRDEKKAAEYRIRYMELRQQILDIESRIRRKDELQDPRTSLGAYFKTLQEQELKG